MTSLSNETHSTHCPDAIIVGSGATGGWAAKLLTEAGLYVTLLEAGPLTTLDSFPPGWSHTLPPAPTSWAAQRSPIQAQCYACRPPMEQWFIDDHKQPYIEEKPFAWIRMQVLGGRLLAWEGQCYRLSDLDFKASSIDGLGSDWPINYASLRPHYDKAERFMEVVGRAERLAHLPDGIYRESTHHNIALDLLEDPIRQRFGRTVTPARLSRLTRYSAPLFPLASSHQHSGVFCTPWKALADAWRTGRLTIVPSSIVKSVIWDNGHARGVEFVHGGTYEQQEMYATYTLLCASTLESTRILLESRLPDKAPALGAGLMDHIVGARVSGAFDVAAHLLSDFDATDHKIYIPRFRNTAPDDKSPFHRGYGLQGKLLVQRSRDTAHPSRSQCYKTQRVRVQLTAFAETLPLVANRVTLHPTAVDDFGRRQIAVDVQRTNNDIALLVDAQKAAIDMLSAAGARDIMTSETADTPGLSIHEVGTARMGVDPETSVVTPACEAHLLRNLFITDGACWVSSGCQNPTLTMMAITGLAAQVIASRHSGML